MRFIQALRYSEPTCIAFVGAGGKTTALFRAAREIINSPDGVFGSQTVLVTTSTHLGAWQAEQADYFFVTTSEKKLDAIAKDLPHGVVLITGEPKDNLLLGLPPNLLEKMHRFAQDRNVSLLIEADGAHTCPLKAPAEHEPAIPGFVDQVIVVAGLSALGKPLSTETVHRPEKFAFLSSLQLGEIITVDRVVKVLLNRLGGLKNIPGGARRVVLLNQADTPGLQDQAKEMSNQLIAEYEACIIASLKNGAEDSSFIRHEDTEFRNSIHAVVEPIAGIILAAGGSSRFGESKQLLIWKGQPLIRHVAQAALAAGLKPVVVVVGCSSAQVQSSIADLSVRIVNNPEWNDGLSTSIKIALSALPKNIGGAVFFQCDQPQIPPSLIKSLVEAHQATLHPIIAPQIEGQRGNPVLFDKQTFSKLLDLEGDMGGRVLFSRFPVQWVYWHDRHMLIDIDTPADYHKFLELYPDKQERA